MNALGHETRFSDSSFYDEVCKRCGGTDAVSDDTLKYPCAGSPEKAEIESAYRKMIAAKKVFDDAELVYNKLIKRA